MQWPVLGANYGPQEDLHDVLWRSFCTVGTTMTRQLNCISPSRCFLWNRSVGIDDEHAILKNRILVW